MDNETQVNIVRKLLEENECGSLKIYSSPIIFLELAYVLKKVYKFLFHEIMEVLSSIRATKQLIILTDTDLDLALKYFKTYQLKFSDCLIAAQIPEGITLVSFDKDFKKIKEINHQSPTELLST